VKRRKALDSPNTSKERCESGTAALLQLGTSRVACGPGLPLRFGSVVAWHSPWFFVLFDDGGSAKLRKHELEDALFFSPESFFDPTLFFYDFTIMNPLRIAGWMMGFRSYLEHYGVAMPPQWLACEADDEQAAASQDAGPETFREAVRQHTKGVLLELAGDARAPRTLDNLKHAVYKAIWWFASMGLPLPPTSEDVAQYLAFLSVTVDSIGSGTQATQAIGFLADVNRWDRSKIIDKYALLPVEALRRRHSHVVRKAPGLPSEAVSAILQKLCAVQSDLPWQRQWHLALGIAIGASVKLLARHDDMLVVTYDDDSFRVFATHIEVLLRKRKTHAKDGHWITIAKQPSGAFCVYDALLLGKRTFTSGFVMPDIDLSGQIHRERPMPYATYVRHLRWALVTICKYSEQEAASFTAHSARSGGATGMVHAGLDPVLGCAVAGVKSIDWFIGYMRANLSDKIRASLAIGPF